MRLAHARWAVPALALLVLAGCGKSAVEASSTTPATGPPPSKVFVADAANRAIGSLIDPNPAPGSVTVDRVVAGPSTGLGSPGGTPSTSSIPSIALDAAGDRLFVSIQSTVYVFDNASGATGNVPFSRSLQSVVGGHVVDFFGLHIAANDVLYAVEPSGEVRAFNNASTLNGSVTPARTIVPNIGTAIASTFGVALDSVRNLLYVGVAPSSSSIVVFNNAATANGTLAPNRTLTFALAVGSFFLDDSRDILYVAQDNGQILVFDNASALATGTPTANRTLTLPVPTTSTASKQLFIFVDVTNNRLYAVNGTTGFIVSGASIADDGMLASTQINVTSASTLFSAVAVAP
jgi:hypothetical protein